MSEAEGPYYIAPYSRANLQSLITKVSLGEITDQEFHDGMEDIIRSWKYQFVQPECPWGWRLDTRPHSAQGGD